MRRWLTLTGGLVVWAVHFLGIYLIASVGEVAAGPDAPAWVAGGLVFSAVCLIAEGLVLAALRRPAAEPDAAFARAVGLTGAGIGLVGIVWQTLPNLFV